MFKNLTLQDTNVVYNVVLHEYVLNKTKQSHSLFKHMKVLYSIGSYDLMALYKCVYYYYYCVVGLSQPFPKF